MENLTKLFYLLQVTRKMPQYGYALSGGNDRMSNLAEHQYLVTMIAWQLARKAKDAGANINTEKVLEFALTHDLGEVFGGDISMPYAKVNPKAREKAKAFEAENSKFLSQFFAGNRDRYNEMLIEILDAKSDEAMIAKVADYVEITIYKQFIDRFSKLDIELITDKLHEKVSNLKDETARKVVGDVVNNWLENLPNFSNFDITIKEILRDSS